MRSGCSGGDADDDTRQHTHHGRAPAAQLQAGSKAGDESLSDNAYDGRSVDDQRAIRKGMATPSLLSLIHI